MPKISRFSIRLMAAVLTGLLVLSPAATHATPNSDASACAAEADRHLRAAERHPLTDSPEQLALYREAERLAEKAITLDPDSAEGHFIYFAARGRRLISEGGLAATLKMTSLNQHLTRALELNPDYAHALAAKGGILLDLPFYLGGDANEAERVLARAVHLNPKGPGTRITYAKALIRQGRKSDARENLNLAAHYACVTRRAEILAQATSLLDELER
jgi:tetratricopeptide (TPR) repeat protein